MNRHALHALHVDAVHRAWLCDHECIWLREERECAVKVPQHRLDRRHEGAEVALRYHRVARAGERLL